MNSRPAASFAHLIRSQESGLIAVILVLGALLTWLGGSVQIKERDPQTGRVIGVVEVNKFLQPANLDIVLKNCSWIAIMAVGATILIISGGIDLSVGAAYCLAAVCGALVFRSFGPEGAGAGSPGLGVALGVLTCLGVGLSCGLVNGALVVGLKVHPFIITLGTMSVFRGLAFLCTSGQTVTGFTPGFGQAMRATWADFTIWPIAILMLVVVIGHVFLTRMIVGRELFAIGGNETAARYAGVRVGPVRVLAFVLAGAAAGIAAVVTLGVFGAADSSTGPGYELDVIAAAVVGGASLSGGRGTALGALLGAIVIQLIANGMVILGIDQNYTRIIQGAVIIAAVVLDRLTLRFGARQMALPA
jgi:ribose/xylose/arabinose/galactoside ABC-type transport system permease subunit